MPPKSRTGAAKKVRRKERKNIAHGHAHIRSTFNNTIVSITDPVGNVISWASSGQVGVQGIPQVDAVRRADGGGALRARRAMEHGMRKVDVAQESPGSGRETAIRSLQATGYLEEWAPSRDVTPVPPPNGCRPPKRRRVWRGQPT